MLLKNFLSTMKNQSNKKLMRYIIYARKSSEGEDRQVQSIDDQTNFLKKLAKEEGLEIVKIFSESKSAKKPGRPVFEEMLSFIQSKKATGILCWKLDRLARNPLDGGKIQWLLQQEVIEEIKTSDRNYLPDDNALISSVELGMANQYIRDLSKNVKRGIKSKLEKGVWPNYAPIGYLNRDKKIVVDKTRSKYIERVFEIYSRGNISVKELASLLFKEGFRSKSGYKYHKSKVHKILTNTFYYGVMFMHDEYYSGTHKPIISKQLFDKVQKVLQGKNRTKRKKHFFTFRGLLRCEKCGCSLTATNQKGHNYYYCTNGKGICEEHKKYLKEENVETILIKVLEKLSFDPEMIEIIYLADKEKHGHQRNYKEEALNSLSGELNLVDSKQERLLDGYCNGKIQETAYDKKNKQFGKEKADLETQIRKIKTKLKKESSTLELKKKLFLRACSAKKDFLQAQKKEKTETLQKLLWNVSIQNQQMANVSFKPVYQELANEPNLHDFNKLR